MAETKHAAGSKDRISPTRTEKLAAEGKRSKVFIPARPAPDGPGFTAWSIVSDEVEATVLAELRL